MILTFCERLRPLVLNILAGDDDAYCAKDMYQGSEQAQSPIFRKIPHDFPGCSLKCNSKSESGPAGEFVDSVTTRVRKLRYGCRILAG